MNWFAWRQHRKQFLVFGLLLAAFTLFATLTGNHFWHVYQHDLSTCSQTDSCDTLSDVIFSSGTAQLAKNTIFAAGIFAPLLLGVFLGSPLLAREYEDNTNKLVWTQSTSRRKWLTAKLLWTLAFAALYGLAVTLLTTWWSRTTNVLYQNRFDAGVFDIQGLTPIAYSIFFTAVGFTIGAWFRKTLVALAITLGIFVFSHVIFAQWVRPHYMTPVTAISQMGPDAIDGKIPANSWMLSRDIVDKNGKTFNSFDVNNMPPQCQQLIQSARVSGNSSAIRVKAGGGDTIDDCLNKAGYRQVAKYQPSYRYWDFQRIEAGIYLSMAILAVAGTYILVLKRDA